MKNCIYAACSIVVVITTLIGCASLSTPAELETLQRPLLVVIDDPRNQRNQREAIGNSYNTVVDYDSDPALGRATRAIAKDYNLVVSAQWPINSLGVHCFVIETPSKRVLANLQQDKRVKWVQPFNDYQVQGDFSERELNEADANKSLPLKNDGKVQSKGRGVKIVVIDTGADFEHPALQQSNLRYKDFVRIKGRGHRESHGTAVVGLIAAQPSQHVDSVPTFSGFAPEASVHHFRGCWQATNGSGKCNTLTLALALDAAVAVKPDLVNLSLSGPSDIVLEKIVDKLIANGSIIVSAFDENRSYQDRFPKPQQGVFFAYGVNEHGVGTAPDHSFVAPANALSLAPNGEYDVFTGHSIATPHLTAMAANYIADNTHSSQDDMVKELKQWLTSHHSKY